MRSRIWIAAFLWAALSTIVLSGCTMPNRGDAASVAFHLQPYPPLVRSDSAPFGLYASPPDTQTLASLQNATLSPDGRFRAARTPQGIWVARVDREWHWQVAEQPGPSEFSWTTRGTLLFADEAGVWYSAHPYTGLILPALTEGFRENAGPIDSFSPDGGRVAYRVPGPGGFTLWVARVDGTDPVRLGDNASAQWRPDGTPMAVPLDADQGRPRTVDSHTLAQ